MNYVQINRGDKGWPQSRGYPEWMIPQDTYDFQSKSVNFWKSNPKYTNITEDHGDPLTAIRIIKDSDAHERYLEYLKKNETSSELFIRMKEFIEECFRLTGDRVILVGNATYAEQCNLTCALRQLYAALNPPEVDPLLVEAREICVSVSSGHSFGWAEDVRTGKHDDYSEIRAALVALRRGMELADTKA